MIANHNDGLSPSHTDTETTPEQDVLLLLQPHISPNYHDALKENIAVVYTLFSGELTQENAENINFSIEDCNSVTSRVVRFLETFMDVFGFNPLTTTAQRPVPINDKDLLTLEKPIKKFREMFRKQLRGVTFLRNDILKTTQVTAALESLKQHDKICTLKKINNSGKAELMNKLQKRMGLEGRWIERINALRKSKVVDAIKSEIYENVQETLQNEYPKLFHNDDDNRLIVSSFNEATTECNYYDESELLSFTKDLMSTIITDFQEQLTFEDDENVKTEVVQNVEQKIKLDIEALIAKNLENRNAYRGKEIETTIKELANSYKTQMESAFNNSTPKATHATIICIEKQHITVKSAIFQEFHKNPVFSDEQSNMLLQLKIFDCFRELVTTMSGNSAKEMDVCRETCNQEISSCLENLEKHLSGLSSQGPKYVGLLRGKAERWLEETLKDLTRGTVSSGENVENLLKRNAPPTSNCSASGQSAEGEEETVTKKLSHIKSMVVEAIHKFTEMTEASRRRSGSTETKASFIRNQVKSQLEFEIKSTFGDCEPTEPHLKELEGQMNSYIMTKMVKAIDDLDKRLERLPTPPIPTSSKSNRKPVKLEPPNPVAENELKNEDISSDEYDEDDPIEYKESLEEGEFISHLDGSRLQLDLHSLPPPLIFQFSVTKIQMGVLNSATLKPKILQNEFEERSTATIVGYTKDGLLVYGPQISISMRNGSLLKTFKVQEHFIQELSNPWSTELLICGKSKKVTVEVLLAFLLRKLKRTAEKNLDHTCPLVVITVPYWLASSQRIQLKDAATIAGFSEIHLINDLSAAAFAFVKRSKFDMFVSNNNNLIMVLSENLEYVDCSVYSVLQTYPTVQLKMLSHCRRDQLHQHSTRKNASIEAATDDIMEMCSEALSQLRKSSRDQMSNSSVSPAAVIVICGEGSNNVFWRTVLENVRMEYTGTTYCSTINENEAVLLGAMLLAKNLDQIGISVKEKVGFQLWRCRTMDKRDETVILNPTPMVSSNAMLPAPGKKLRFEACLPRKNTLATFYQSGVATYPCRGNRISEIPVGYLKVYASYPKPSTGVHKQLIPALSINHEGILSFDYVLIVTRTRTRSQGNNDTRNSRGKKRKRNADDQQNFDPSALNGQCVEYKRLMENEQDILWKTPRLSEIQIEEFKKIITDIELRQPDGRRKLIQGVKLEQFS